MELTIEQLGALEKYSPSVNNVKHAMQRGLSFDQCIEVAKANGDPYEVARSIGEAFTFEMAMSVVKEGLEPRWASQGCRAGMKLDTMLGQSPVPGLLSEVASVVLQRPSQLSMDVVSHYDFTYGVTRCLAGWAIKLHPQGMSLKQTVGWEIAGRSLLGRDAAAHFADSNSEALAFLEKVAAKTVETVQ